VAGAAANASNSLLARLAVADVEALAALGLNESEVQELQQRAAGQTAAAPAAQELPPPPAVGDEDGQSGRSAEAAEGVLRKWKKRFASPVTRILHPPQHSGRTNGGG
jgi:hypothetical protein